MGVALTSDGGARGLISPQSHPHLRNISDYPAESELLVYFLHPGLTT